MAKICSWKQGKHGYFGTVQGKIENCNKWLWRMYINLWNLRSRTISEAIRNMSPENPMAFHCVVQQGHSPPVLFLMEESRFADTAAGGCDCIRRCWLPSLPTSCGKSRIRMWWYCCLPHGSQVAEQECTVKKTLSYSKERAIVVMQKGTTVQKSLLENGSLLPCVTFYVNEHDLTFQGKVRLLRDVFSGLRSL